MQLLEREWALATLAEARDAAARGEGRVVLITGEPGIGKTWLVKQFLRDSDAKARVLFGTCDDLSIPRPLGPIRDLVGSVSAGLAEALSAGAAPYDIQALLIAELELPPRPTMLVLGDVHWADDATFDSITVLGRRIGSLPALLVLTFRAGEVPPGHRLHATVGAIRAEDTVVLELAPLSEHAVTALAGDDAHKVYTATGGNPFYVTELLASRAAAEMPPSVANAVLGRASRLDHAARRLVDRSRSSERVRRVVGRRDAGWALPPRAGARQLLEVDSVYVRFRHELARNAIRSSIPIAARRRLHAEMLAVLLATKADPADIVHHAEAAGAEDVVAEYALVAARRAAALESNREAYSHYRRASNFVDRLPAPERAAVLEGLAWAPYVANRIDEAFPLIERAIGSPGLGVADAAVGRARGRCRPPLVRRRRRPGRRLPSRNRICALGSRRVARAYSGFSRSTARRERRACARMGGLALELALQLGAEHRAQAPFTSSRKGRSSISEKVRRCSAHATPTRPATVTRRAVRHTCLHPDAGCASRAAPSMRSSHSPTPRSTRARLHLDTATVNGLAAPPPLVGRADACRREIDRGITVTARSQTCDESLSAASPVPGARRPGSCRAHRGAAADRTVRAGVRAGSHIGALSPPSVGEGCRRDQTSGSLPVGVAIRCGVAAGAGTGHRVRHSMSVALGDDATRLAGAADALGEVG